jgi:acyl-coenzyme A thioesterase 9
VKTGSEQTTNDFRFTWCRESGEPLKRIVVPQTYKGDINLNFAGVCHSFYSEAMLWLEGKRALETGAEIRALRVVSRV